MKNFVEKYLDLISTKFKGLNLTRITDVEEFKQKQYEDSLLPFSGFVDSSITDLSDVIIDVGFGGGFPLLPMAVHFSGKNIIGFDARQKKSKAVNSIIAELKIPNARTFHSRIEDVLIDENCLITFKAVSTIEKCLASLNISEGVNVFVLFYKGRNVHELEGKNLKFKNWELQKEEFFDLTDSEKRCLLLYKYVPRRTSKKSNEKLVKVSELLKNQ